MNKVIKQYFYKNSFIILISYILLVLIILICVTFGIISLNVLSYILEFLSVFLVIAMFLSLAVVIMRSVNYRKLPAKYIFFQVVRPIASIILIGFTVFILSFFFNYQLRKEVRGLLSKVSLGVKVTIDEKISDKAHKVIEELKKVAPLPAHRSHNINRIDIYIQDVNSKMHIIIGRDSDNHEEYWVFYPKYKYSTKQEIGRIKTDLFDEY